MTAFTGAAFAQNECTDAPAVTAGVPVPFTTIGATASPNRPTDELCPGTSLAWLQSPDVWFRWTAPVNGIARFSTCDPFGYDSSMVIYTGTSCSDLVPVACNGDAVDSTGCQDLHSEVVNFEVTGGTTYYIRIGGFEGAAGSGTFGVTYSRVGAWGSNAAGQLRVPMNSGMLKAIAGGGDHALGLRDDGSVVAWGLNVSQQANVPATVGTATAIAAGGTHSLALRSNGTVAAWGRNSSGQSNVPATLTDAVSIAAGANHSLAARATGAVVAWGSNTFTQSTVPAGLTGVVQVGAGEIHSIARRSNGSVAAWGSNTNGQTAVPVTLTNAVDIAGGGYHNLAIRANRTVVAWGFNDFGQRNVPTDLAGVVDVAAGRYHSLALKADGSIVAWGYNANGQVDVPANMGGASQIAAGVFYSMALRDGCPTDPAKVEPGACGCGLADVDTDGDGVFDCNDLCPTDPAKTAPGACGCGNPDTDTDSDGTADCNDQCPTDPSKTEPGQCGCGNPDTDTDGDGTPDCNDQCPDLAALTAPVSYHADADGDGFGAKLDTAAFCSVTAPAGYTTDATDCDDATLLYLDGDADTFGSTTKVACNGVLAATDCDDAAADVFPGAAELCANDGVDNNCNGEAALDAESADVISFYIDGDQDGFGAGAAILSCSPVSGTVTDSTDCDDAAVMYLDGDADTFGSTTKVACNGIADSSDCNDAAADVFPGAAEACADLAVDNDCDGDLSDAEAIDSVQYFVDGDADEYGAGPAVKSCSGLAGHSVADGDCDDANATVFPGAPENCANLETDNDCDGVMSDAEASDSTAYYTDSDFDGFGIGAATRSCSPIPGSATVNGDCDDTTVMYLDADGDGFGWFTMVACGGVDDSSDCNDSQINYADFDRDTYGSTEMIACGGVLNGTDCDDAAFSVHPGAVENCDNILTDNDCDADTSALEAVDSLDYFVDGDADTFGAGAATRSCVAIDGSVLNATDCDDASAAVYPGALENCDNIAVDNDCDANVSADEAADSLAYFVDGDQDGFGAGAATKACAPIAGSVTDSSDCDDAAVMYGDADLDGFGAGAMIACGGVAASGDCNDSAADIYPGAIENCTNLAIDNDCDTVVLDDEAIDSIDYYTDADTDSFGAGQAVKSCSPIDGRVATAGDCDDASAAVYPGAAEACLNDGIDNDCDGEATLDDESIDAISLCVDADGDGFGFGAITRSCTQLSGMVADGSDCDDAAVMYGDADLDGFGAGAMIACGGVATSSDCDDAAAAIYPGAIENCDNILTDNDCDADTSVAEAVDSLDYFVDGDADTFGAGAATRSCVAIDGSVLNSTDCDDASAAVYPGAIENCDNIAVDNDCDADVSADEAIDSLAYFVDGDQDGFGAGTATKACAPIAGSVTDSSDCDDAAVMYGDADLDGFGAGAMIACGGVATSSDCDDAAAAVYPGAIENCENIAVDNDCDADTSVLEAIDSVDYFVDGDADTFGAGAATRSCVAIDGSVLDSTDCDDASAAVYPGAIENCDNIAVDNDCDADTSALEAIDSVDYFVDGDVDTFGAGAATRSCTAIEGSVLNATDCDDASAAVYPGAIENCDNIAVDNDCDADASADEAIDSLAYFVDGDQDGFGAGAATRACAPIAGSVTDSSDCDDANVMYGDADLDGFGAGAMIACGGVATSTDCDDASAAVYPGAIENCENIAVDNDCDADVSADEAIDSLAYFVDGDQDGFGAGAATRACAPIAGSVTDSSDCDDANVMYGDADLDGFGAGAMIACGGVATSSDCDDAAAAVYPGAIENCENIAVDNDCDADTSADEAIDSLAYFVDGDQDGFGAGAATRACAPIAGSVTDSSDCDDAAVMYGDADLDGFGAGAMIACGGVATSSDCDDAAAAVYPGAAELCADLAVDNDCDGSTAEDEAADRATFYADADADTFGDPSSSTLACAAPQGYVAVAGDLCPANGQLQSTVTYYRDLDNDGAGDAADSIQSCESSAPAGYSVNSIDGCPADSAKTEPGACGCGVADSDTDADGTPDCTDGCPNDPAKVAEGTCGCGTPDTDTDGDGRADCIDNCDAIANADQRDCNANGIGDACEIADGTATDCNANGQLDACDLATGTSTDLDGSGSPDECEFVVGGTGYATIQAALDNAPNGTVIKVGPGTYGPIVATKRGVTIQSIAGERFTFIDGGGTSRCVEITGRASIRFALRGFTIRNGAAAEGAGMLVTDADPVVEHCIFTNNIATGAGGAVRAIGSSGDFALVSFLSNHAASGGAVSSTGLSPANGSLHFASSLFRQNTATADGGAIENGARVFLLECTIDQNVAGGLGGAVKQLETGDTTLFTSRLCRNVPDNINGPFVQVGDNILSQDCNANGICDADEISGGTELDCNGNGFPDSCDLSGGTAADCNTNGIPDSCDIAAGTSTDVDANGIPDECKPDCNGNDIPDAFEIATGAAADCNTNGIPDSCDITANAAIDCNANGLIDECELADGTAVDCDANGLIDTCDVANGAKDIDTDGRLDRCEFAYGDFNLDGGINAVDLATVLQYWGPAPVTGLGDANGDGQVDAFDMAVVLSRWGVAPQ